jgi:hypothetical protein
VARRNHARRYLHERCPRHSLARIAGQWAERKAGGRTCDNGANAADLDCDALAGSGAGGIRRADLGRVVVNDGSTDDTADFLATVTDPRVRVLCTSGVGAAAARNLGLDAVRGAIVTHLDDDNLMDPLWLRGVAWGFSRWPDAQLLYGARIVEDGPARDRIPSGAMPSIEWQSFDRKRLEQSITST